MIGMLDNAVIVGCDVLQERDERCPRMLIINQGANNSDLVEDTIHSAGWDVLPAPAGDSFVEHACLEHRQPRTTSEGTRQFLDRLRRAQERQS